MKKSESHSVHAVHGLRWRIALLFCLYGCALSAVTGCKVKVDKSEDGQDVKVATPFGSIAVNRNQTSAADAGLPAYPGATLTGDGDGDQSTRVDMGFGNWKLRVRVAQYATADGSDQVLAFYRKALSTYGEVIECSGKQAVGTPSKTKEGLTCADDDTRRHLSKHGDADGVDVELKAGSQRHQHLMAIKDSKKTPTQFTLIALDLPHGDGEQHGTN